MGLFSFFQNLFGGTPKEPAKKTGTRPMTRSEVAEITERTRQQIKATSQRTAAKKETPPAGGDGVVAPKPRKKNKRKSPKVVSQPDVAKKNERSHANDNKAAAGPKRKPQPEKPSNTTESESDA